MDWLAESRYNLHSTYLTANGSRYQDRKMVMRPGQFLSQVTRDWDSPFGNPAIHSTWKSECASSETKGNPLDSTVMAYCSAGSEDEDEVHSSQEQDQYSNGKHTRPSLIGTDAIIGSHFGAKRPKKTDSGGQRSQSEKGGGNEKKSLFDCLRQFGCFVSCV